MLFMSFSPDHSSLSPKKIMNTYRSEKGFFSLSVPMFMAKAFIPREDREIREALRDIHQVRLLVCDDACNNPGAIDDCIHDFSEYFRESGYVEIMQVKDEDTNVSINVLPGGNCFRNLIMIVSNEGDFVVIHLSGSMNIEQINKLIDEDQI
jgi:hypothetical protein